ncbi:aBC-type multidrug transport system ATPase component [Firmicutes bacterium CAG:552]|nr:aBC-type multidrug transport system ATPase component [Firmicutes bacterium CAG:552]
MVENDTIIEIKNLTKSFGEVKAVNGISLKVNKGELFAFLGVNGAGKSTTIDIMCGLLARDGGKVVIDGVDIDDDMKAVSSKIGVVFQNSVLDGVLTVRENLTYRAALYGIYGTQAKEKIAALAEELEFTDFLDRRLSRLSGGQRRRADVARALINDPSVLILDEPTTGLDPQTRKTMWKVIGQMRQRNDMTVFLTTHYMEEAADADYVVILDSGKVVAKGTPLQLKNSYAGDYITLYGVSEDDVKKLGKEYVGLRDAYRVRVDDTKQATELILAYPSLFVDYEVEKGKMDDVFLAVTGKKLGGNV